MSTVSIGMDDSTTVPLTTQRTSVPVGVLAGVILLPPHSLTKSLSLIGTNSVIASHASKYTSLLDFVGARNSAQRTSNSLEEIGSCQSTLSCSFSVSLSCSLLKLIVRLLFKP